MQFACTFFSQFETFQAMFESAITHSNNMNKYNNNLRLLENQEYFDHYPSKYLIMAQVHCLYMFAMKIILHAVQKTTITFHYINTVIEGDVSIFENPSNINRKLIFCYYF